MKQQEEFTEGTGEASVGDALAEKAVAAARFHMSEAQNLVSAAMDLCAKGEPRAGQALLKKARQQSELASFSPSGITPEMKEVLEGINRAAHNLSLAIKRLFGSTSLFLKDPKKEFEGKIEFKKGGSFTGTKKQKDTLASGRSINWYFWTDKETKCKKICLISVFHFRKNVKVVTPAKKGFKKSYIDTHTGRPKGRDTLPHDGGDVNGFAVDTPFYDPANGLKAVKCPCYLIQYPADEAGDRAEKGRHVGGYDAPNAMKSGYMEYFETAAVCMDDEPYVILNSMKWRTNGGTAEILGKNGKPLKKGKMDLGDASPAFKRALLDWIARAKKKHKIDEIDCK